MNSNLSNVWSMTIKKSWLVLLFVGLFALAGCGGGGSSEASLNNDLPSPVPGGVGDGGVTPGQNGQPPAQTDELALLPKVTVSERQFADPNVLLTLDGTVEAAEGAEIVRTLWIQVSGPTVEIPSPLSLRNLILMPDVNTAVQLEFRLVALDNQNRINSATTSVLVKPVPTFVKVIGGVFNEAEGLATFTIRLNAASTLPVSVSYITRDGTADSETDYVFTSGVLVFEPGEVMKDVSVELIDDTIMEDDESFSLRVTAINGEETHANVGIAIIRNGAEPQQTQQLAFTDPGPVTIYLDDEYTNPMSTEIPSPGTGDIMYSSSNTEVATVDANGVVVGVGLGEAQITATKLADDVYLSASASYNIQVISRGTAPEISILLPDEVSIEPDEAVSIELGATLELFGVAIDQEEGDLPTQAQRDESSATGQPITSLTWESDLDGFLGYGDALDINTLSMGTHLITYSVTDSDDNTGTDSVRVLVGNIAPSAGIEASPTYCPSEDDPANCYSPDNVNDSNLSTALGGQTSWTHEQNQFPAEINFYWSLVTVNTVDIYSTEGFPVADYDILDSGQVLLESIRGNTEVYRSHPIPETITSQLTIRVLAGPTNQPGYGRINEVVVFGESQSFSSAAAVTPPAVTE
ncbi:Calx-beta domain-containing protein [Cellvibrio sp. ARAG 10.3]|uniref:Calx-beta domain-containing protein n=1 Tax=Cellvibrio sp. ARAG 10.3 TaxID=3451358 RepID=UPI003F47CA28